MEHVLASESDTLHQRDMERVPLRQSHTVLVLSTENVSAAISDSRTLISLIKLQRYITQMEVGQTPLILCEFLDPRSQRLLDGATGAQVVPGFVDFFHSNQLETGLASVLVNDRIIWPLIVGLHGAANAIDAQKYFTQEEIDQKEATLTFWELTLRARERGDVVLGCIDGHEMILGFGDENKKGLRNRLKEKVYHPGDQIVVLVCELFLEFDMDRKKTKAKTRDILANARDARKSVKM